MLISLTVSEAIISYRKQTNVWLPEPESLDSIIDESRKNIQADEKYIIEWSKRVFNQRNIEAKDLDRRIFGKFTQGGKKCDYKRYSSRLIIDNTEYDFVIADAVSKNMWIVKMLSCPMEQNWVQLLLTVTVTVLSIYI